MVKGYKPVANVDYVVWQVKNPGGFYVECKRCDFKTATRKLLSEPGKLYRRHWSKEHA